MATCIDIKQHFGKRYRYSRDESAKHDPGGRRDPWHYRLLCRYGHIFPWGGNRLGASTDKRGNIGAALTRLDCCRVEQDGTDGVTVSFDVADFDKVARLMKPRRRRQLSADQRARLLAMGFGSRKPHAYVEYSGAETHPTPDKVSEAVQATSER